MTAVLLLYKITVKSHFLGQNRLANVWGVKFKNIKLTLEYQKNSALEPHRASCSAPLSLVNKKDKQKASWLETSQTGMVCHGPEHVGSSGIKTGKIYRASVTSVKWTSAPSSMDTKSQHPLHPQPVHLAASWQKIQKYLLPYDRTTEQLHSPGCETRFTSHTQLY